ncbi:hypothetical protein RFI_22881, partial [Reticulomyxa filosa]
NKNKKKMKKSKNKKKRKKKKKIEEICKKRDIVPALGRLRRPHALVIDKAEVAKRRGCSESELELKEWRRNIVGERVEKIAKFGIFKKRKNRLNYF